MTQRRAPYRTSTEHNEQVKIMQWRDLQAASTPELLLLYAVPNGAKLPYKKNSKGQRFSPEAMRLKAEGLNPGVPDLCLPVARGGYHGLYIELKWGDNKPTERQKWWLDNLSKQGYLAVACWGEQDAIEVICEYLEISKPEFI